MWTPCNEGGTQMTFNEIMNSPLLYGLVGQGIAYIILFCLITLKKA